MTKKMRFNEETGFIERPSATPDKGTPVDRNATITLGAGLV
jgi:hypothetical protein